MSCAAVAIEASALDLKVLHDGVWQPTRKNDRWRHQALYSKPNARGSTCTRCSRTHCKVWPSSPQSGLCAGHHLPLMAYGREYLVAALDWHRRWVLARGVPIMLEADFCMQGMYISVPSCCLRRLEHSGRASRQLPAWRAARGMGRIR